MSYSLVLLNGPQAGAGIPLNREGPPVTIGRDPSRELPIDDPACSRLHARLWHDGQQWWIEDCGSRNGTFVNSRRIERMTLQPGDAVRIGERLLVFVDERRPNRLQRWTPSDLKTTTFVARVPEAAQQRVIQEELCAVADSAAVRRAAVLCRLAGQLHDKDSVTALVELVSEALQSGTDAE
ncbi:MAG: FHA domain-containing protein, partial [Planctomycetes bacterium]|nr:FHA domain-containing protein [Planctomycetota bacterium]